MKLASLLVLIGPLLIVFGILYTTISAPVRQGLSPQDLAVWLGVLAIAAGSVRGAYSLRQRVLRRRV